MDRPARPTLLLLLATGVGAPDRAGAVVVREDVADAAYLEHGASPEFAGVGMIADGGTARGTGTLIAPRWVLTAAHVIDEAPQQSWIFMLDGAAFTVEQVVIEPRWTGAFRDGHDLALLRLATVPVAPPASMNDAANPVVVATIVGFGATGGGDRGYGSYDLRRRAATNLIEGTSGPYLLAVFDPPGSGVETPLEGLAAPIDSGGPLFVRDGEGWSVAAVQSWIEDASHDGLLSSYRDIQGSVRLGPSLEWIRTTIDTRLPGDATSDGRVDTLDLVEVLAAWGLCTECAGDLTGDGFVDAADLVEIALHWSP